jgi:hypothetical protein
MQPSNIYSIFYLVLWKFWRLSPRQKYAYFFQPNGNPTWYFWGLFLSFWMLLALLWAVFGAQIWAANINTGYQILVVLLASLIILEFTYQVGFLIFLGIGLGHFLSVKSPNYKSKSFAIHLMGLCGLTGFGWFIDMNFFAGCVGFSVLCLAFQLIGFVCMHFFAQLLLGKTSEYKSSTLLDEHLTK